MTTADAPLPQEESSCSEKISSKPTAVEEFLPNEASSTNVLTTHAKTQMNPETCFKTKTEQNASDSASDHAVPKRRNKNRRKRKWKPFCKMNWTERKQLEERDARRANRMREKRTASGLALAPYNTTQFLMEDHNVQEPNYEQIYLGHRHRETKHSSSSEEFYSSPEDEEEFLHQQFSQTYEDAHTERLNNMSKIELVEEFLFVQDKVEAMEKILEEVRANKKPGQHTVHRRTHANLESEFEKIRVFRQEIEKLKKENDALERENERLRIRIEKRL